MRASSVQYYDEPTPMMAAQELQYAPRNRYQSLFFLPGVFICGVSWMANGIPILTDLSFLMLIALCIIFLIEEFATFSRRFGMGGITLFGGILIWFCYDYMTNWFFIDYNSVLATFTPVVIAKSAFFHHLFIFFAVTGLHLPIWERMERLCANIPEPTSHQLYITLILIAFVIGMVPYVFFTTDAFPVAIWKAMFAGRAGGDTGFTVGRTGNVNESWGAYLAQFLQVGQIGAILAIFYVIVLRPNIVVMLGCIFIWLIQVGLSFGSGTRGETAYIAMPALFLLFLKYQSQAAELFKRWSIKAYVVCGMLGFLILVVLQIQITYRNTGFSNIHMEEIKAGIEGNSMFSEGLAGMALIPDHSGFFYNTIPGEGAILAIPNYLWRFAYGPIPRALWPGKPIDPMWAWYNHVVTGRPIEELEGTTVSTGLIGDWYFRFGIAGIVEGGLLCGWLFAMAERMLQNSQGKLIQMITAIGLLVFLFRGFRGVSFINLYPLLIGVGVLILIIRLSGGGRPRTE